MMFRKGDLVEVLRREDDPCGSWYTAKILSADGDSYVIRYKLFTDRDGNRVVETVRGKDVRLLPPYINRNNWAVGDVAEVFDVRCWRIGKVAKVLKKNDSFVIKMFGSIQVKEFHASSLRVRQAWHGNKWMVVGEVARSKDSTHNSTPKVPFRVGCLHFKAPLEHKGGADKVPMCLSMRAIRKVCAHRSEKCNIEKHIVRKLKTRKSSLKRTLPLFNRIDEPTYQNAGIDEKSIKLSTKSNNQMEDTNPNCVYHSPRPDWSTENSDQCSIASCSFNGVADYGGQISPRSSENTPNHSDAESSFPSRVGKVVNIHELELRAYKSTVEALYVSGPLTWEQEEMLTDLRLSLNISDKEHLLQLRHLMSAHVL